MSWITNNQSNHNKFKFIIWLTLQLALVISVIFMWQSGAKVNSDILAMLPQIEQDPLIQRAQNQVEQHLANRIYLSITGEDEVQVIHASKLMIDLLSRNNAVFSQVTSADSKLANRLNQYYFKHRFKLLTSTQSQPLIEHNLTPLIQNAQSQLYSTFGYANSDLLTQDPLLLFPENMLSLASKTDLTQTQGILIKRHDGLVSSIVMAKSNLSVFNPNVQQIQFQTIVDAISQIKLQYPNLKINKAGALFHARAATENAKQEVSIIGSLSLAGVVLLVWLTFRSLMPLAVTLITVSTGLLFAITLTLAIFGEIHLLTLVFGTSLIGIAIDYSFHFYCEKLEQKDATASDIKRHILPAISLALSTSILAYIGIGIMPFPGMQQVAIFCAAGLFSAYITLILAYPSIGASKLNCTQAPLNIAQMYLNGFNRLSLLTSQPIRGVFIVTSCFIIFWGLSQLKSNDDIRALQQSPIDILAQEAKVRGLLSGGTDNQFLLVQAQTKEELLQKLEALEPDFTASINNHEITSYISLANYIPSQKKQNEAYALQSQIYRSGLSRIESELGLSEKILKPLTHQYQIAKSNFITPETFLDTIKSEQLAALWLPPVSQNGVEQYASIVLLGGVKNITLLADRIDALPGVSLVDKVASISDVMAQYKGVTLKLITLALCCALIIFSFRFGVIKALIVVAIPTLAITFTITTLGLLSTGFSLFHALALLLVLGIGIDYSLFFAEAKQQTRAVMLAVFLSASSTLLAFGLLALSQTPAIHNFGLTLAIGIGYAFFLSPFIQILTRTSK